MLREQYDETITRESQSLSFEFLVHRLESIQMYRLAEVRADTVNFIHGST